MSKNKVVFGIILLLTCFSLTGMKSLQDYSPAGNWSYEIEAGEQILSGVMTIKKVKDDYEVQIESNVYGTLLLSSVDFNNPLCILINSVNSSEFHD
ncbi:hypothetical protein [uncultured Polaribacter sp.]|uniref:hypothetical protein n=1 Tax=uncultured Polaribacter sp. TaxID=174711 RepID=UPI0026320957|nr:hypothetical protein [uncultured Polaribacter sp.]